MTEYKKLLSPTCLVMLCEWWRNTFQAKVVSKFWRRKMKKTFKDFPPPSEKSRRTSESIAAKFKILLGISVPWYSYVWPCNHTLNFIKCIATCDSKIKLHHLGQRATWSSTFPSKIATLLLPAHFNALYSRTKIRQIRKESVTWNLLCCTLFGKTNWSVML